MWIIWIHFLWSHITQCSGESGAHIDFGAHCDCLWLFLCPGLQGEGLHGQIVVQCSVWLDHRSHQPCNAQQTRHGRIRLCKSHGTVKCCLVKLNKLQYWQSTPSICLSQMTEQIYWHDYKYLCKVTWHVLFVFSVCPSVSWTCLDSRTSRKTPLSSCASTIATKNYNITSVSTSLSLNKWVCFYYIHVLFFFFFDTTELALQIEYTIVAFAFSHIFLCLK